VQHLLAQSLKCCLAGLFRILPTLACMMVARLLAAGWQNVSTGLQ